MSSTANQRFKEGFADWFWVSLILATAVHTAVFEASPVFAGQDVARSDAGEVRLTAPPETPLPDPPEPIRRPVVPVISPDAEPDATFDPIRFDDPALVETPPPPTGGDDAERAISWTPMEVAPRLRNDGEVARALRRHYPPTLRDAGIGGVVKVWFHIDRDGRVTETRLNESSGYASLDAAALEVAGLMEFTPAYNRDQAVAVWVSLDIRFEAQDRPTSR